MFITRRSVLSAAALEAVSRPGAAAPRPKSPNEQLDIAGIGVGGMGATYLAGCASENIVALCDVDRAYAAKTFAKHPHARVYTDYRRLLESEKSIDAIIIGTPDHTHADIALAAMELGKHVYCAKPLTRTISESRRVAAAAAKAKVATQMSVQSCASDAALKTVEWVRAGAVGNVREVHVWSDRPVWPQAILRPAETPPAPDTLDWNGWLGSAPLRPYHPLYHPFNWRGWYDFGTGALGDMGCHTLHVIVQSLNLRHPSAVSATSAFLMEPANRDAADQPWMRARRAKRPETFPSASIVTWEFGELSVVWYDGGLKPPRPIQMAPDEQPGNDGILFVGSRGVLLSGFTGGPRLLPEKRQKQFRSPERKLERSPGHYLEWINACKGGKPANCNFEFGSLLTEICLLGCLAVRTGRRLVWDAAAARFPNDVDANTLL